MQYKIEKNEKYNSCEVVFDGKPSESIREKLKKNGFRWHRLRGLWYGYTTAEKIKSILDGVNDESVEAVENGNKKAEAIPEKKAEATPIKFYYNGIKLDGGKLQKVNYYIQESEAVLIAADIGTILPRDIFEVSNDSDAYSDYYDTDGTVVAPSHPLYKFVLYAAKKADYMQKKKALDSYINGNGKRFYQLDIEATKKQLKDFESLENVGQPSNADLLKVDEMNARKEAERIARQEAEDRKRAELYKQKADFTKKAIEQAERLFPLDSTGKTYALILWSENNALYEISRENGTEKHLSLAAADFLILTLDNKQHATRDREEALSYYDKTAFIIYKDGEAVYQGRYDIGDGEGGLVAHIKALAEWDATHNCFGAKKDGKTQEDEERLKFAEWLATEVDRESEAVESLDSESIEYQAYFS